VVLSWLEQIKSEWKLFNVYNLILVNSTVIKKWNRMISGIGVTRVWNLRYHSVYGLDFYRILHFEFRVYCVMLCVEKNYSVWGLGFWI